MIKSSNLYCLSSIQSLSTSILNPKSSILLPSTSNLLYPTQFSIVKSSSSIPTQKNKKFDSKCPQNSVISNKMSARATCTACTFFQVWTPIHLDTRMLGRRDNGWRWGAHLPTHVVIFIVLLYLGVLRGLSSPGDKWDCGPTGVPRQEDQVQGGVILRVRWGSLLPGCAWTS